MIRFSLCCIFRKEFIKFRRTTAKYLQAFHRNQQLEYIAEICLHNAHTLQKVLGYCCDHDIKNFRINSQILPLKTHPDIGYSMEDLPAHDQIIQTFKDCGRFCQKHDIRTTFHPDQFILLSSPSSEVVQRSVADLIYQAEVAQWVNADVINIHGGGAYGDKRASMDHLRERIGQLPEAVRSLLTLENDDWVYAPKDLLPVCRNMCISLVYDVHHHRCLPDGRSVEAITELVLGTWNREPLFHLSSPKYGWESGNPRNHPDYIDADDFQLCRANLDITGGQESTILSFHITLLHHGFVAVGLPYTFQGQMLTDEITGGSPYGASTIAGGSGERMPSENEQDAARFQGKHVATIVLKLTK